MNYRSLRSAASIVVIVAVAAGCSKGGSVNVDKLRGSTAPYYYVGPSFDGFKISHVIRYRGGVAEILYGTCKAGDDQGCGLPLELQHRLCHGRVTVSIFTGQGSKPGSAQRAAKALRPLSRGAIGRRADIEFEHGSACT